MKLQSSSHPSLLLLITSVGTLLSGGWQSSTLVAAQLQRVITNLTTPTLNLTTIAARNGRSTIECWSLPGEFAASTDAGTSGALNLFLGRLDNATFTVIPPRFDGGLHRAPAAQLVAFMSGLAHVTLPNTTVPSTAVNEAWVQGGKYGLIMALDTADVSQLGHITTYPGAADTVTLQLPFKKEYVPQLIKESVVLYDGPCAWAEMAGL